MKTTPRDNRERIARVKKQATPGLLVAKTFAVCPAGDRFMLSNSQTIGRNVNCTFALDDELMSGEHFIIFSQSDQFFIEDLNSTNGTFVNGQPVLHKTPLKRNHVILAGDTLFVFHDNVQKMFHPPTETFGIAGTFHVEALLDELREAAQSVQNLLITGPMGAGKELASRAITAMIKSSNKNAPFVIADASTYISKQHSTTTIFGVVNNVFTGVDAKKGFVELAQWGVLLIDEAQYLCELAQGGLLRIVEYGETSMVGDEANVRKANVRIILATNVMEPHAGLIPDLHARLRIVHMPPLNHRIADVPSIFAYCLEKKAKQYQLPAEVYQAILNEIDIEHYEMMCLDELKESVRLLLNICDLLVTKASAGKLKYCDVVSEVFQNQFAKSIVLERQKKRQHQATASSVLSECHGKKSSAPGVAPEQFCEKDEQRKVTLLRFGKQKLYEQHKPRIISVFKTEAGRQFETTRKILMERYNLNFTRTSIKKNLIKWGVVSS